MRIVVCLATVVDPEVRVNVSRLRREPGDLPRLVNAADACALEAALRLKDSLPGARVEAVTVGPPTSVGALRWALALGADDAELLWDEVFSGCDCGGVARILAAAIRRRQADLVLCGTVASDGSGGAVGPMLAELLKIPLVATASSLVVRDGTAHVERRLGPGGRAAVRCALPALVTVEEGSFGLRYARVRDRLAARRAEIPVVSASDLGVAPGEVGTAGAKVVVRALSGPKPNPKGISLPDVSLSPEDQLAQLMSGGLGLANGAPSASSPGSADQVEEAVNFLIERGFADLGEGFAWNAGHVRQGTQARRHDVSH